MLSGVALRKTGQRERRQMWLSGWVIPGFPSPEYWAAGYQLHSKTQLGALHTRYEQINVYVLLCQFGSLGTFTLQPARRATDKFQYGFLFVCRTPVVNLRVETLFRDHIMRHNKSLLSISSVSFVGSVSLNRTDHEKIVFFRLLFLQQSPILSLSVHLTVKLWLKDLGPCSECGQFVYYHWTGPVCKLYHMWHILGPRQYTLPNAKPITWIIYKVFWNQAIGGSIIGKFSF